MHLPSRPLADGQPTTLAYAPRPPAHSRPVFRRSLYAISVVAIVGLLIAWWRPFWVRVQLIYWEHRCLTFDLSHRATTCDGSGTNGASPPAATFDRFYSLLSPTGRRSDGVLFLHGMRSPAGAERLVVVEAITALTHYADRSPSTVELALSGRVFRPGGWAARPLEVTAHGTDAALPAGGPTTVHGATIDPTRGDHFTATAADIVGRSFAVDGWLRDDDTVAIEVRPLTP